MHDWFNQPEVPSKLRGRGAPWKRLGPAALRSLAANFAGGTASSLDGFRMGHLRLLSDEALTSLEDLMLCTDIVGMLPPQTVGIAMPTIPKASGGHRLIGLFSFFYRLWAASRRPVAAEWETCHTDTCSAATFLLHNQRGHRLLQPLRSGPQQLTT